jgi:sec-independent protein translocase protein TatA
MVSGYCEIYILIQEIFMGLGPWHLLVLIGIVLIFFGPSRLPGLGKSIGEAIRGFKKGLNEDNEIDVTEASKRESIKEGSTEKTEKVKSEKKEKV